MTVLKAILTGEGSYLYHGNLMSDNFHKKAVLKKKEEL